MAESAQGSPGAEESTALLEGEAAETAENRKLELQVEIEDAGPCRKHVRITIPRAEIDRIFDMQVGELASTAEVPGFRPGHVPESLIRKRFRKELSEKVKHQVLMLSLEQLSTSDRLEPINEPDLDVEGMELPEEGDFSYEFDIEVRPEFELPDYHRLTIERPVRQITDADVDAYTQDFLEQYAQLVPVDEPAQAGDSVVVNVQFTHQGQPLREFHELVLRVRPVLRFYDAELAGFDQLMAGASANDIREADLTISMEADNLAMRGEQVHARFTVLDVKRPELPELNEEFLRRLGVASAEELRQQLRRGLERQVEYEQRQATRQQVLDHITASADWELPEEMLRKQVENAMRREILELQQAGFTTAQIRAREADLRQKSLSTTERNLKQHFILDRIAEREKIEVSGAEIDAHIAMMALQSGENPRRVRSRLVKSGLIENLEAQIRERKAVDVILSSAKFVDRPLPPFTDRNVEGVNRSICGVLPDTDVSVDEEAEA